MTRLLDGALEPITYEIGFVAADLRSVTNEYGRWMHELRVPSKLRELAPPLPTALYALEPLTARSVRDLWVGCGSSWSAVFTNLINGGDLAGMVTVMTQRLRTRGLRLTCVPHTLTGRSRNAKGTYGATMLEIRDGSVKSSPDSHIRTISVANDGGRWRADTSSASRKRSRSLTRTPPNGSVTVSRPKCWNAIVARLA